MYTLVTQRAIDGIKKSIDALDIQLNSIQDSMNIAGETGDRWHDEAFKIGIGDKQTFSGHLQRLNKQLSECQLIVPEEQDEVVKIGNLVKIEYQDGRLGYIILDGIACYPGACSYLSPVGRGLREKKVGDILEYKVGNNISRAKILEIIPPAKIDQYVSENHLFERG